MKVKLKNKKELRNGVLEYSFESVDQGVKFEPGQFFTLTLVNPKYSDERGKSRIFGFTNNPADKTIQFITYTGTSAFKRSLSELPVESEIDLDKISGDKIIPDNIDQKLILIADVIGVAPFLSIIRKIKDDKSELKMILFYIFEKQEDAICLSEIESFTMENPNFKLIKTNSFTSDLITENINNINEYKYYIRGEKKFVIPAFSVLKTFEIEPSNISMEIFTGY